METECVCGYKRATGGTFVMVDMPYILTVLVSIFWLLEENGKGSTGFIMIIMIIIINCS